MIKSWSPSIIALIILLTAPFTWAQSATSVDFFKPVALYINLFAGGQIHYGNPNVTVEAIRRKLAISDPAVTVKKIIAADLADLQRQLNNILEPDEQISQLLIDSHGSSRTNGDLGYGMITAGTEYLIWGAGSKISPEGDIPGEPHSYTAARMRTLEVLAPIRGRFTDEARIALSGCNLFAGDGTPEIGRRAEALRAVFDLKNGGFYGNSTKGDQPMVPNLQWFWQQNTVGGVALFFVLQTTLAIGIPSVAYNAVNGHPMPLVLMPLLYFAASLPSKIFRNKGLSITVRNGQVVAQKFSTERKFVRRMLSGPGICERMLTKLGRESST